MPSGPEIKLKTPVLHATLHPSFGGPEEPDVYADLRQVAAIARGSNRPGCKSRVLLGDEWFDIADDFEELKHRWLTARGIPINR